MSPANLSAPNWSKLSSTIPAGWFRAERLPDSADLRVDEVVRAALHASDDERPLFDADEIGVRLLETYAVRASTRAVRQRDVELVRLAAAALVLAQPVADYREQMRRMSVVADAADRLGTSLVDVAAELSTRWPPERLDRMKQYMPTHAGGARGLAEMDYRAEGDGPDLRYLDELSGPPDPGGMADLLEWPGGASAEVEDLRREAGGPPAQG